MFNQKFIDSRNIFPAFNELYVNMTLLIKKARINIIILELHIVVILSSNLFN